MTFNRRKILSVLAALPFAGALFPPLRWISSSQAAQANDEAPHFSYIFDNEARTDWNGKTEHWTYISAENFAELKEKLDALPNQCMGNPGSICEATGEPYVEISYYALARPGDEAIVERVVANKIADQISKSMINRRGKIYWRIPFETEITNPYWVVTRYADDGPDKDFITDRRCYADTNWVRVSAYVRFTRAKA